MVVPNASRSQRRSRRTLCGACAAPWLLVAVLAACADDAPPPSGIAEAHVLATGAEQKARLCSRGRSDLVLDVFCAPSPPRISGLRDLRRALGVDGPAGVQGFAVTGHSTSLVSRFVSALNPRIIFITEPDANRELLMLAFARGEQFSEVVVRDRRGGERGEFQFYVVTFEQACNAEGCLPGDLLTEAAETGWRDINVYAEEDLANTPLDCRVCHQPSGPGTRKILRMQELEPPWNHWFYPFVPGGRALSRDYVAAKRDERFAGLTPQELTEWSNPGLLSAALYFAGSVPQPNAFVSARIQPEVRASAAAKGGAQPEDNSVPGESETWDVIYERSKTGEAISVPYHDVKVTDPDKLAAMTAAYNDYLDGKLARQDLPNLLDIYPDDERLLARMGFATEPGMSGQEVLMQACAQCHNDRLDQTISRARFNVDLSKLTREQRQRAIARVLLPVDDPRVMPPALFRRLSEEAKARLVELLE